MSTQLVAGTVPAAEPALCRTPPKEKPVTDQQPTEPTRPIARTTGLLYCVVVVLGLFAEVGVRARLIEPGDALATAGNIADAEWLFRVGVAADLVVFLADVALAVLLFRLFEPINRTLAMLAAAFRLTQTAIIGLNLLSMFRAVRILEDADYLDSFAGGQVEALAMLSLDSHKYGYILGLAFFGTATILLGYMGYRSDYTPRPLGLLLCVAGAGYLVDTALFFLVPGYDGGASAVILAPAVVAEAWFALWLLTKASDPGARNGAPVPPRVRSTGDESSAGRRDRQIV